MHFIDEVKIKRAYQQGIDDATDVLSEEDDDSVPVTIKDGEPEYIVQGGFSVHKSQDVADAVCRFWTESNNERDSRNLEHHSNS